MKPLLKLTAAYSVSLVVFGLAELTAARNAIVGGTARGLVEPFLYGGALWLASWAVHSLGAMAVDGSRIEIFSPERSQIVTLCSILGTVITLGAIRELAERSDATVFILSVSSVAVALFASLTLSYITWKVYCQADRRSKGDGRNQGDGSE